MSVRGTTTLGAAQALALAVALASATVYAAWLDAAELALWAVALGAGRAAMLLVDGGLKAALVRHAQDLQAQAERRLTRTVSLAALALSVATVAAALVLVGSGRVTAAAAGLVSVAIVAYLMSHAVSLSALARLERSGRFDRVGRIEALATVLEFGLPALGLASGMAVTTALGAGVVLGRAVRALGLLLLAGPAPATGAPGEPAAGLDSPPWRDGLALQAIAGLSMLRDQAHLWLVAPVFGAAWAGAYAFALMACALASQVLVATVARVAVPALRPLGPRRRALRAARSLRRLSWLALPLLAATTPLLHAANQAWWQGQWDLALVVLPGLLLRMAAGLPLAVMAPWLLLAVPAPSAARVHARWTAVEALLAAVAVVWIGPVGLAVSWALGGFVGTLMFAWALRGQGLRWFLRSLVPVGLRSRRAARLARA